MEVATSGERVDQTNRGIQQWYQTATVRFNKTIAIATIRFMVAVVIIV